MFSAESMRAARERADAVHDGGIKVPSQPEEEEVKKIKPLNPSDQEDSISNNNTEPTRAERRRRIDTKVREAEDILVKQRGSLFLPDDAYYGLVGDTVKTLGKYTQAGYENVMLSLVAQAGNMMGRSPHTMVGADRHGTNIYAVVVGETATGSKGQGLRIEKAFFNQIAPGFAENNVISASARSGEGLLDLFADETQTDKRVFMTEEEYSTLLSVQKIQGNRHIVDYMKVLWDGINYSKLTVGNRVDLKDVHYSYLAHITPYAFRSLLAEDEIKNGFINRFFVCWTQMRKVVANPDVIDWEGKELKELITEWKAAMKEAESIGQIVRSEEADEMWEEAYVDSLLQQMGSNTADKDILARSNPNKLRLANIYAALDGTHIMTEEHIRAASSLWAYCETSVLREFGKADIDIDPDMKKIMELLKSKSTNEFEKEKGISLTEIQRQFKNRSTKEYAEIKRKLEIMVAKNKFRMELIPSSGGKPERRFYLVEE